MSLTKQLSKAKLRERRTLRKKQKRTTNKENLEILRTINASIAQINSYLRTLTSD